MSSPERAVGSASPIGWRRKVKQEAMTGLPRDLVDLLVRRAGVGGDQVVYIYLADGEIESDRLTFGGLDLRARALAVELLAHVRPGSTALLLHPPGLEFTVAIFGCLYAGIIAVPAYPPRRNQSLARIEGILADAGAAAVLTTSKALDGLQRQFAESFARAALPCIATDRCAGAGAGGWKYPLIEPESLALLQYTSGSTAAPKAVMLSHRNILSNQEMIRGAFGHGPETVVVGWLPMYHDMGLIGNMIQPLYCGGRCVLMPPVAFLQRPARWLQAIARYRATTSGGPSFAYQLCADEIDEDEKEGLDLSSWTLAFNGAEPVRHRTLERFAEMFGSCKFQRTAFYPCYGLAEASLFVTGGTKGLVPPVVAADERKVETGRVVAASNGAASVALVSCGRPWLGQRVDIVEPETLQPLAEGTVGEIWIAGPNVAQGYWNRPEETERTFEAFTADGKGPYLRTGDLGAVREGELFVTGRLKDLILIRGRNIYPHDIELCVEEAHPLLRRGCSAAFSVDLDGEERLLVIAEIARQARRLAADPDSSGLVDQVVKAARKAVADQHEVQLYGLVLIKPYSLPKTSSGKVRRSACRERFLSRNLDPVAEVIGRQVW